VGPAKLSLADNADNQERNHYPRRKTVTSCLIDVGRETQGSSKNLSSTGDDALLHRAIPEMLAIEKKAWDEMHNVPPRRKSSFFIPARNVMVFIVNVHMHAGVWSVHHTLGSTTRDLSPEGA
jgi:hypothetical protein